MADTKISALSAGAALAGTEEIPGVQSAATVKFTPAQIRTYVQANMTAATIASGTITSSTPGVNLTQTWNSSGVTFKGMLLNITDTASASGSLLADFQVGGSSLVKLKKNGLLSFVGTVDFDVGCYNGDHWSVNRSSASPQFAISKFDEVKMSSAQVFGWTSSSTAVGGTFDLVATRAAAGVLAINGASSAAAALKLGAYTVATLPAASSHAYSSAFVSDATATTARSTVSGGGSNKVMVFSDGTNWLIVA